MSAGHGDNRETLAQAMYGKSEDDMSRNELNEMKRLMRGEAATEQEAAAEHDAQIRAEDNTDYAANLHRPTRTDAPIDQLASTGRMDADDVRREYPATEQSAQGVTAPALTDKKP
jgi:hypothetical protein